MAVVFVTEDILTLSLAQHSAAHLLGTDKDIQHPFRQLFWLISSDRECLPVIHSGGITCDETEVYTSWMSGVRRPFFPYHFGTFLNRTLERPWSGELLAPDLSERQCSYREIHPDDIRPSVTLCNILCALCLPRLKLLHGRPRR